jgi:signal transduction histidine kinase
VTGTSLRTRIAVIVSLVALGSTVLGYLIQREFLYEQFLQLERPAALADLHRSQDALHRELEHLAVWNGDWAAWDDTYRFVQDGNADFVAANLTGATLANVRCNAVWFVAADGRVVLARGADFATGAALDFPELPADRFPETHPLLPRGELEIPATGVLRTGHGALLVSSRQVVTSDVRGPAVGWFICGRLVTDELVGALAGQTHVPFRVRDVDDPTIVPVVREAVRAVPGAGPMVLEPSSDVLTAVGVLNDVWGRPAFVVTADLPREIARRGGQAMAVATACMVLAGTGTIVALVVLLSATVVTPLRRLTDHALRIGRSSDLSARSGIVRSDEIGVLAGAFDDMVAKLADSRAQVADTARRAGVSDASRGVLHNVGNVLTSVTVSASAIADLLRRSRTDGVVRGAEMIEANRDDLVRFLTEDRRGRVLPEYLRKASAALREERAAMLAEVERLQVAVAHAADIVARQGEFATGPDVVERVSLETAVGAALTFLEPTYARHGIELVREVEGDLVLSVDRTRLSQILVNLLANAKEAFAVSECVSRRVVVRAGVNCGRVVISVSDNGPGIARENLARIFECGFSTKRKSRGFGLHYCAVTAREMGGSLRAESEGAGRGATFVLELPVEAPLSGTDVPAQRDLVESAS